MVCSHIFRFLGFFLLAQFVLLAKAQQRPVGTWKSYTSFNFPLGIEEKEGTVFCLTTGGFFSHEISTGRKKTYTPVEGMSGLNSTTIYHDKQSGLLFIGYDDGAFDYFSDPSDIQMVTDIKRSTSFTTKTIRKFRSLNGFLYIATDFGIVVYDITKKETKASYTKIGGLNTGAPVSALEIWNDSIFAAMGNSGLFGASMQHPNLADPSAWNVVSGTGNLPVGNCIFLGAGDDKLFAVVEDSVFQKSVGLSWGSTNFQTKSHSNFDSKNDVVIATGANISEFYFVSKDSFAIVNNGGSQTAAHAHDNEIWVGDASGGLIHYENQELIMESPDGPLNNFSFRVAAGRGELYISPAGRQGSAPSYDNYGFYYFNPDSGWINFANSKGTLDTSIYRGFTVAHYDAKSEKAYMGSNLQGIVELSHGKVLNTYIGTNSGLLGLGPQDIRMSSISTDPEGGLWATTILGNGERTLNYKTAEGLWYNYQMANSRPVAMIVDDYGNKWVANENAGISVFSEKSTPNSTTDDKYRVLNNNLGNGALPSIDVLSLVQDKTGQIWAGTGDGVWVFYDPFSVYENNFPDGSCPVYENQCLLKFQKGKAIAVDGANRKWIGTEEGAFLMNAEGTELIFHFTKSNSPLFADNINDISIDPSTGEVFFATERGLISYMGDAVETYNDGNNLSVFPNPVLSGFDGDIVIRGMLENSKVKIANASGAVVQEMPSLGGQAVWDGKDKWGNKVKPGVYIIMVADDEGKGAGITKVAIIGM